MSNVSYVDSLFIDREKQKFDKFATALCELANSVGMSGLGARAFYEKTLFAKEIEEILKSPNYDTELVSPHINMNRKYRMANLAFEILNEFIDNGELAYGTKLVNMLNAKCDITRQIEACLTPPPVNYCPPKYREAIGRISRGRELTRGVRVKTEDLAETPFIASVNGRFVNPPPGRRLGECQRELTESKHLEPSTSKTESTIDALIDHLRTLRDTYISEDFPEEIIKIYYDEANRNLKALRDEMSQYAVTKRYLEESRRNMQQAILIIEDFRKTIETIKTDPFGFERAKVERGEENGKSSI